MNPTEMRSLIPTLGLPEYWYPALPESSVPRDKPTGLKIMGEEIAFFRDKDGSVAAIADVCPHRGGSLRRGDCQLPRDHRVSLPRLGLRRAGRVRRGALRGAG